jgi:transcriptional regulator GlxA family with amidase domain
MRMRASLPETRRNASAGERLARNVLKRRFLTIADTACYAYTSSMKVRSIGIAVYDAVETLDVAGPADVFSSANQLLAREPAPYDVVVAGARRGRVAAESGVSFHADTTFNDNVAFDTIIVPGGKGLRLHSKTRGVVKNFLLAHAKRTRRIASVCTGIYALADTSLLDGRNVTTHWRYAADVQRLWPKLNMNADAIFIKDGKFYTSAGVTAGIDLSLSFVEEDFGSELALAVAREIIVYLKRSGGQLQYSQPLLAQTKTRQHFGNLSEWIRGNLQSDLTLEALAERIQLSPRHFARKFKATLGLTPADFVEQLRLDEARWLLESGDDPVNDLAQTVGYGGDDTFRRAFERRYGIAPAEYRRRFRLVDA